MSKTALTTPSGTPGGPHPPGATIALVQSSSLPMLVQRELERMILAGDLAAGIEAQRSQHRGCARRVARTRA